MKDRCNVAPAVTGQHADKRIAETAERLIRIYKESFGVDWQQVYRDTVVIHVAQNEDR